MEGKADSTINRSVSALRRMFRLAKRSGKLRDLPFFPMLKEADPRKGVLEKYELLRAALPDYLRPVLAIGYHTGMRRGEILNLRWEQVDFLNRIIRLNAGETKNDEGREIPIDDELLAALQQQHLESRPECPLVCTRTDHEKAVPIGDFRKVWYDRCVKLGLGRMVPVCHKRGCGAFNKPLADDAKNCPACGGSTKRKYFGLILHDLRRTFITDAEHAGAPRHEVMKGTGHKTESVYKRYAIGNREGQRAAMDKIAAYRAAWNGANTGQIAETAAPLKQILN